MRLPTFLTGKSPKAAQDIEELPFFGPLDPPRWPLHKTFFLGGILFFPLWFIGAFLPVRDSDDNCASSTSGFTFRLRITDIRSLNIERC